MDERQEQLFLLVAEVGSFSRAEEKAFISKQAIIKQINLLEREVGVTLLQRTSRGVAPTAAGKVLLEGLRQIAVLRHKVIEAARHTVSQPTIHLASVEHHRLIAEVEAAFCRQYPQIHLEHHAFSTVKELQLLQRHQIDLAETRRLSPQELAGLNYAPLLTMPYQCLMQRTHPLAGMQALHPEELRGYPVIVDENPGDCPFWDRLTAVCGKQVRLIDQSESSIRKINLLYDAYANGAVCITPSPIVRTWDEPQAIPFCVPDVKEYGVAYRLDAPPEVKQLVQFLQEHYATQSTAS